MSNLSGSTASCSSSYPSSTSAAASRKGSAPGLASSTAPGLASSTTSSQHSELHVRTSQSPVADFPSVTATSPTPLIGSVPGNLKRFRKEQSVRYTSNLPHFLRSVDWLKRNVVEDVHWLLENLEPEELDLSVALELLSFDFIDERVRGLAVQRLEILSNDEVLKYLLQLVQVCVILLV